MKKVQRIEELSDKDIDRVLEVWESSVRATHDFLDEQAIVDLIPQVKQGIQYVETFLVIKNTEDLIIGFAGIYESKIEMLFVHDDNRKQGIGKSLLLACINDYRVTLVDVNEQNPQAVGFYQHLGFNVISRSEKDDAGNPYPILHLSLQVINFKRDMEKMLFKYKIFNIITIRGEKQNKDYEGFSFKIYNQSFRSRVAKKTQKWQKEYFIDFSALDNLDKINIF